jgi:hypothetical protein
VLDGDEFVTALERAISETTVGVNWYINQGHRHKLQVDASRLVREFGEDPDAVIDGEPAPITKVVDQEDWRIRAMVQLVF